MSKAISQVPFAQNEPVKTYAPGSAEVKSLIATYKKCMLKNWKYQWLSVERTLRQKKK
ncbi:Uncharacterised protein [Elizabethkingia anophelis]|uniref:Uncharacterized protein n=1 Tax=Elizabethkingia anophelis TaxID=1117645 RepID=A0A7Z7LY49_9FLAO|nr:Uncharacterised protein [Elizabethkingia anophelis]